MKKVLKIILTIICWLIGVFLLYETINSFNGLDPAGLGFIFFTLPVGIFCVIFLISAISLTKDIIKKKNNDSYVNDKNKSNKRLLILMIGIVIVIIGGFIPYIKYSKTENVILHTLIYDDMGEPGSKSEIKIYNDKVEITTTHFCSAIDCSSTTEKEIFNYSKENIEKLKTFINNNFSNNYIELNDNELTDRQKEVIQGILLGEYFFETNVEEYKYKIEYSKNDSLTYDIYFKNDNSILVKKLKINSDYDIVSVNTYSLNFSQKNKSLLFDYVKKEVKKENDNIIYKYSTLQKDEINIFNSIIENNETYLNNIESEAKLTYTISYNGINCPTPTLYLYSDNTYEYYYTFGTDNEKLIPKTGTFNYDITKIISNIDKYEENSFGPYLIKEENGKNYTTYNTNTELQELLTSLDIKLKKCLEQQ